MAHFMTSTSTVIFRRFDDVHVKLLLCLQDEIGQLEKELMRLDGASSAPGGVDKGVARVKVMRELRREVAEYGECSTSAASLAALFAARFGCRLIDWWIDC